MDKRTQDRHTFITQTRWVGWDVTPFPGDASTRSYFRLSRGSQSAILMDAPGQAEAPTCPAEADEATRHSLGYNAMARLAGSNMAAFVCLAQSLTARGFSAPEVFDADLEKGFLILEDLGDDLLARIIPSQAHEGPLYAQSVEVLAALYRSSFDHEMSAFGHHWVIQSYDSLALQAEADFFLDWYVQYYGSGEVSAKTREYWHSVWGALWPALDQHAPGLALRDFHAENLIWLPQRQEQAKIGLLDFQDGLFAHPAYDLVSLLEDARRDVSAALHNPLKDRFFEAAQLHNREEFEAAYAILAAQRNAKILGIFVRLMIRDQKPRYEAFMGRVVQHFIKDLTHPILKDVRELVQALAPELFKDAHL